MLEVKNLSKRYGDIQALESVSFSINPGEIVGFLGINGAGKSTTMNIISGYISATDGDVIVDGSDILTDSLSAKSKIGYLPEHPPVYPEMKVIEYLTFLYDLKKVRHSSRVTHSKADHLSIVSKQVGIEQVSNRLIRTLSKGYCQRVGLAGALIGNPDILILDEPTVGLDPAQIIEIRNLIQSLSQSHTVLLSSHILPEIQFLCDRIIVIHQGRLVADGTTQSLAQSLSAEPPLTLEVEGVPDVVLGCLSHTEGVLRAIADPVHPCLYHLQVSPDPATGQTTSVRRRLFYALAKNKLPILSMSRQEMGLEDIFLKLTSSPNIAIDKIILDKNRKD